MASELLCLVGNPKRVKVLCINVWLQRSDVAGLRRSKAELETKVSMLEQQIGKMQWAIEHADQQQAAIEEQLDTALKTGGLQAYTFIRTQPELPQ